MSVWLTPRHILVILMLIVAPGAAIAHLMLWWLPETIVVARLENAAADHRQQIARSVKETERIRRDVARLRRAASQQLEPGRTRWLEERDCHGAFDRLAGALQAERLCIEQLTFDEPGLYAAAPGMLLACEQVSVLCTGDYAALTGCLERLARLQLPLRFTSAAWKRTDRVLSLEMRLQVPFVPNPALGAELAEAAGLDLEEDHEL